MANIAVTMSVDTRMEHRGDHWAAMIVPLGITVYASTEDAAADRLRLALRFMLTNYFTRRGSNLAAVREYLDRHGIQHTISREPSYSATNQLTVALGAA